jgi:sugar lactone lactonase YvrE
MSASSAADYGRETFVSGLGFPEAPRWHDRRLWLSDIQRGLVLAVDGTGAVEEICEVDGRPSGLGWLPDGRLLVVSMHLRQVLRLDPGGLVVHADLASLVRADLNDMVVDADGWAFVTNFGYDANSEEPTPTGVIAVSPDGHAGLQGEGLYRPNGCAIRANGDRLVVAETRVHRLTAFDLSEDRLLSNARVIATLPRGTWADGICLDAKDCAWVADPKASHCFRVSPTGEVLTVIDTGPWRSVACVLGGPQRRTLYVTLARELRPFGHDNPALMSRIDAIEVDVPGAGWP